MVTGLRALSLAKQPRQPGLLGPVVGRVAIDVFLQGHPLDGERAGRMLAPVEPLAHPHVAETVGGIALLGVDRRAGKLGHQVAPRHRDLDPILGLDREAVAVAQAEIVAVDEFQPAAALGAVALDPEAESVELVPIVLGVHPGGEELRAGGLDQRELAGLAELAVDEFHRAGRDFFVVLGGHLARLVQDAAQIAQQRLRRLAPGRRGGRQSGHDQYPYTRHFESPGEKS